MTSESRRNADAKRAKAYPWRRWYYTARWKRRRDKQLMLCPWCEPCKRLGVSRRATVANHVVPHRGDPHLFWYGELESACASCHNLTIQRAEHEGFRRSVDADGWPTDPLHPFNRIRSRADAEAREPQPPKEDP